jgi:hypothetical protein
MKRRIRVTTASSLLALGALGLTDCGGGDDEDTTTAAQVSTHTTTEATVPQETRLPTKLSPELVQALRRDANTWASLIAVRECNRYMSQPACERMDTVSAAFRESFADATVEDIKYKGTERIDGPAGYFHLAAVTYSNGVVVVFDGGRPEVENPQGSCAGSSGDCTWNLADVESNRRFFEAEAAALTG